MSVNAREERFDHVELYGMPALFTNSRIDRATVPEGWYCYDMRGSDYDTGLPTTVEDWVVVNHTATVLSPTPLKEPDAPFRTVNDDLNFLGEEMSLDEFCEAHNIEYPKESPKFKLRPASPDEAELFYSLSPDKDAELGTIGHVRIDFGKSGDEFWHTWWQRGDEALSSAEFKTELDELVRELRSRGPLSDLNAMSRYCYEHGEAIEGGYAQNYGFISETENYRFCLRCIPVAGDYNAYLTAYDLRAQKQRVEQGEANEAPSAEMTMDGM